MFRRQHPIGPFIIDFYCANASLAVEVDGMSHGMGDRPERDARRDAYLQSKGIRGYRIAARTVLEDPDWVAYGLIALASEIIASNVLHRGEVARCEALAKQGDGGGGLD